jgi:hypothetical protein
MDCFPLLRSFFFSSFVFCQVFCPFFSSSQLDQKLWSFPFPLLSLHCSITVIHAHCRAVRPLPINVGIFRSSFLKIRSYSIPPASYAHAPIYYARCHPNSLSLSSLHCSIHHVSARGPHAPTSELHLLCLGCCFFLLVVLLCFVYCFCIYVVLLWVIVSLCCIG